jgi:dTDP-4-amino-4,6-dideoxygalactose transaminase
MSTFFSNPKAGFKHKKKQILAAISKFIDSGEYILGTNVKKFEDEFKKFLGNKGYFVSCASGTDAITLALLTYGIKGKIIVPSHTATASIIAIQKAGCEPVYADINPQTLLTSINHIHTLLKKDKNIQAVLAVHLYGSGMDMNRLLSIAKSFRCIVIEDCAQSCGTIIHKKQSGTLSSAGCFSFFPTKNLPALGDGGGLWLPNKKMKEKAESIRQYGWNQRRIVRTSDGMNSRLDEILAVVLRIRLQELKKDIIKRRNIANLYDRKLSKKFNIIYQAPHQQSSYHLYIVRVKNREKLISFMKKRDIFMGIHYYPSNHMNGILKSQDPNLKVTEKASKEVVSLPIFPELSKAKQINIIKHLNNFLELKS